MASVIILDNEDAAELLHEPNVHRRPRSESVSSTGTIDDLEVGECPNDLFFAGEIIDLTCDEPVDPREGLHIGEASLNSISTNSGVYIKREDFLEVENAQLGGHPVNFIKAKTLLRDRNGAAQIRGVPYTRTRNLQGKLQRKLNEVCMILVMERREGDNDERTILFDVSPNNVVKKRTLVTTNTRYPANAVDVTQHYARNTSKREARQKASSLGNIICRWQLLLYYKTQCGRRKPDEEAILHMREESVPDDKFRVADCAIRQQYGNDTGCSTGALRKYTVFDSFCGGGGVSRGALLAGFRIKYAIDKSAEV